ncbi:uncharacterized protein [Littorina saxatilis]|uniref:Isopentenyl phosphate kinase n=2 Tax=Littorina saxatilis TaxID=31220 RepID=A0AAN9GI67_9CAEN
MSKSKGDNAADNTLTLVIKLGGAAITDKSVLETLRPDLLQQGAALIKRCHDEGQRIVVVHGAGSFGHHQAKLYKVNEGLGKDQNYQGFCLTRNSVTTLNKHVVECLTDLHLPAVACPAFPGWQTSKRAVNTWPRESISDVIQAGLIPVFHGDCVLDSEQGCCVLSGDTIIETLCSNFDVKRVVFLTDVQGVYDKPPHEEGAKLVKRVSLTSDGQACHSVIISTSSHDVTGGILTKLRSAQKIAALSSGHTKVFIAKIGSRDAKRLCLDKNVDVNDLEATEIVLNVNK